MAAATGVKTEVLFCINPVLTCKGWFIQEKKEEVFKSKNDFDEYTFYNINTDESILTTRRKFQDSHMDVAIHHVLDGNCTTAKGWTVLEIVDQEELRKAKEGRTGSNHHLSDKNTYDFVNINTLEKFTGTRLDLKGR
mgnify:CR=1 FL=1